MSGKSTGGFWPTRKPSLPKAAGGPSWRKVTDAMIRDACHSLEEFPESGPILERLLGCKQFWLLLECLMCADRAKRDKAYAKWTGRPIHNADRISQEYLMVTNTKVGRLFSPVKFTQSLLILGLATEQSAKRIKKTLRRHRAPYDQDIRTLREIAQRRPDIKPLLEVSAEYLQTERDEILPIHPDSPAPAGATTRRSLVFNEISRRIPKDYPERRATIEALAAALLGVSSDRFVVRDLYRRKST